MSEEKDGTAPIHRPGEDDWLLTGREEPARRGAGRLHRLVRPVALVAAGLIVGGGAVATAQAVTGDSADGDLAEAGGLGARRGAPPPGIGGGRGGLAGEQHLAGTLTAISDSSVTVRTATGTATYSVTDRTQVLRDGQVADLGDLERGDEVLLHVLPPTSAGDDPVLERLLAGQLPSGPGLGPRTDDDGAGHPDTDDDAT